MKGFYKGELVTGALRLALRDHAEAVEQLDGEIEFLNYILAQPPQTIVASKYDKALGLRNKLIEEKHLIVKRFADNWLKEG
jgi:hypothetical protein